MCHVIKPFLFFIFFVMSTGKRGTLENTCACRCAPHARDRMSITFCPATCACAVQMRGHGRNVLHLHAIHAHTCLSFRSHFPDPGRSIMGMHGIRCKMPRSDIFLGHRSDRSSCLGVTIGAYRPHLSVIHHRQQLLSPTVQASRSPAELPHALIS